MKIAVIGGGVSGIMAAGSAKGAEVTLFEHTDKIGKKIYITGKGRCNCTNACDAQTFLSNVVNNASFLRGALYRFSPDDAIALLAKYGCKTKTERGRRVFPNSDKASDVTKALWRYAQDNNVNLKLYADIQNITPCNKGFNVKYIGGEDTFDKVIICTGGLSYPQTGSDGSAFSVIKALGHTVSPLKPSLVALKTAEDLSDAEGLTLKNVTISADGISSITGELLVTSDGISGPIALTLSAYCARREYPYKVYIDLKPAMTAEELDKRLLRDFSVATNRQFKNSLGELLPKSIISYIISKSGIDPLRQLNSITKAERVALCGLLKHLELNITGNDGFDRAVVTSGGVNVKMINPKTMESRIVRGLYFAGEVLDVDALTGGYNFHIALATGYVAGSSAVDNE